MIVFVKVSVNDLVTFGKDFPWRKPRCPNPRCGQRVWWHGFELAYFSNYPKGVHIRRVRCPHCKMVHRLKPLGYWKKFRYTNEEIRRAVKIRQETGHFPEEIALMPTMKKWWRALSRMVKAVFGISYPGTLLEGFDALVSQRIIPVSLVMQCGAQTFV